MKTYQKTVLSLVIGAGLGGVGVHAIYAQAKAPVFYVGEIDVTDEAGYLKDFVPLTTAAVQATGGRFIARGGQTTSLSGEPVKKRVVISQWDSMEQLRNWFDSPEQTKLRAVQAKYSKVRAFSVEGLPQK